jgi:hypothetical protein
MRPIGQTAWRAMSKASLPPPVRRSWTGWRRFAGRRWASHPTWATSGAGAGRVCSRRFGGVRAEGRSEVNLILDVETDTGHIRVTGADVRLILTSDMAVLIPPIDT